MSQFRADLERIEAMYPSPITRNSLPDILVDKEKVIERHQRFLGAISNIQGTFMGIYMQHQINDLASQINDLDHRTEKLIDHTSKDTLEISKHTNLIRDLSPYAQVTTIQNPAITIQDLSIAEQNITRALEIAGNTFQMA